MSSPSIDAMELHGSITPEQRTFIETWENVSPATNYIIRENRRGDEEQVQVYGQGRKFRISTYERMLTEERALDPRNNPFKNGAFRPVIVPQDVDITTNPNAMSDEDITRLFAASDVAWDEYMKVIDSPATLNRMMELAEASDLSHRRFRQLETMHEDYTNIGKRLTNGKYQDQIDALGPAGQGTGPGPGEPAPLRRAGGVAPTKAAPTKAAAPAAAPAAT